MAVNVITLSGDSEITPAAFAAPAASEDLPTGDGVWLWVKNGATTASVTISAPGNDNPGRTARAAKVIATFANGDRIIRLGRKWAKFGGLCTVTFSSVATVTAVLIIESPDSER